MWRQDDITLTLRVGHLRRSLLLAGALGVLRDSALDPQILMIGGIREARAFEFPQDAPWWGPLRISE